MDSMSAILLFILNYEFYFYLKQIFVLNIFNSGDLQRTKIPCNEYFANRIFQFLKV